MTQILNKRISGKTADELTFEKIKEIGGGGGEIDSSLSVEGVAADAKAVGDKFAEIDSALNGIGAMLDDINGEVI